LESEGKICASEVRSVFGSQRSWNTENSGDECFVSYLWSFKHLTVDQVQIPPLSSQVKAFFNLPPWETMLLLAESTAGKVKQLAFVCWKFP